MLSRNCPKLVKEVAATPQVRLRWRPYSSTTKKQASNRIYSNMVRTEEEFENLNLLSASSRVPLITLWGATWCPSCKVITPLVRGLIESGVGQEHGGVSFAEIQLDSPTLGPLAMRYTINSLPTLLAFDRQEAQLETRVTDVEKMKSEGFLTKWIETEAKRHGSGGAGGGGGFLSGFFGR